MHLTENQNTYYFDKIQKQPKNSYENRTKSGKRKPLTPFIAKAFYTKPF